MQQGDDSILNDGQSNGDSEENGWEQKVVTVLLMSVTTVKVMVSDVSRHDDHCKK